MTLSEDVKQKIIKEYKDWEENQYSDKSLEERQSLGAFFTPPELTIRMIEKFENLDGPVLDPTSGAGGLISACIIAGADPEKCFTNEIDPEIKKVCEKRLTALGVPKRNILPSDEFIDFVKQKTRKRFGYLGPYFEDIKLGDASDSTYVQLLADWISNSH